MWCPKCYGSMKKKEGLCIHCGFRLSEFSGATNQKAMQAIREGKKEDVLYTSDLPIDIRKKPLLLFCIFLGMFGGHNYYVGKFGKAIYSTITAIMLITFAILNATHIGEKFVRYFYSTILLLQGINLIMWIWDFIHICLNRFKVPVYKEEFSKNKKG